MPTTSLFTVPSIPRPPKRAAADGGIVPLILVALSLRECFVWRCNSGLFKTPTGRRVRAGFDGAPDVHGFCKRCGRAVYLEAKSATGVLNPDQKSFRRMAQKHPVIYGVPRSVADAIRIIEEHRLFGECRP